MNRLLLIGSLAGLLIGATGCLHHNTRGGSSTCGNGSCGAGGWGECGGSCGGDCESCSTGSGLLGKLKSGGCGCGSCGTRPCNAEPLGWQQGALDYSQHLKPGFHGHHSGARLNARPFTPGPPSAQVAYPYYSIHGPRDFLMDNPPSIGR